jgi:hypothetical protein
MPEIGVCLRERAMGAIGRRDAVWTASFRLRTSTDERRAVALRARLTQSNSHAATADAQCTSDSQRVSRQILHSDLRFRHAAASFSCMTCNRPHQCRRNISRGHRRGSCEYHNTPFADHNERSTWYQAKLSSNRSRNDHSAPYRERGDKRPSRCCARMLRH